MARQLVLTLFLLYSCFANAAIDVTNRVNCYPDPGATQSGCEARGCVWSPVDDVRFYFRTCLAILSLDWSDYLFQYELET